MGKETTRGGARPNAGRGKVTDKLIPVTVSIRKSRLDRLGGPKVIQSFLKRHLDNTPDEQIKP